MVRQTFSELVAFVLIPAAAALVAVAGFASLAHAGESRCVVPVTEKDEAKYLKLLEPFCFKASGPAVDGTSLLYNFIAVGCEKYQVFAGGTAPQGAAGIASDLETGLKKGLRCLSDDLGKANPKMKLAAARVLAFLDPAYSNRSVRIACGAEGQEVETFGSKLLIRPGATALAQGNCSSNNFPTIAVNLTAANRAHGRITASILHEMLHIAGYPHDTGIDVPYLATTCCFDWDMPEHQAQACALLRDPALDWRSPAYQTKLADYMSARGAPDKAYVSAYNAYLAAGDSRPLLESVVSLHGKTARADGYALAATILGIGAAEAMPDAERPAARARVQQQLTGWFYPSSDVDWQASATVARVLGGILGLSLAGRPEPLVRGSLRAWSEHREELCARLNAKERARLKEMADLTRDRILGDAASKAAWGCP